MSLEVDSACNADYPKGTTKTLKMCHLEPHIAECNSRLCFRAIQKEEQDH